MTRLANVEKAGYFPLPPSVTDLIRSHITAPHEGRILDPCAGEGAALVTFAERLGLDPYGIELHEDRAAAARQAVEGLLASLPETSQPDADSSRTHLLHDSYLNLITSRGGYNFLYLNPPYDYDEEDGRLEYQWLVRTRPWLQAGGLLVWVVPQHLLKLRKVTRYILSWYEEVQVYRFPDDSYDRFRQIVLFGLHLPNAVVPDAGMAERFANMAAGKDALPPLTAVETPSYTLPLLTVRPGAFQFRSQFVDPADALAEARQLGASTIPTWREHLDPNSAQVPLQPLTPLKIGHMNSVIAAGHLNNQILEAEAEEDDGDDSERLLIKGRSYKVTRAEESEESLPDGRVRRTQTETEAVVTDITTLDPQGQVTSYKGAELENFLQRWISHLTGIIAQEYPPRYEFDLNGYGSLLGKLSKSRPIPGLNGQTGLLPAQKHAAAAALTRLENHQDAVIVGEMGSGKTAIGAAIAAGMGARRVIVLCPPHLVAKWRRECKIVWPAARTMHLKRASDVDQFFGEQPDNAPLVGVLKQTTARSASGWEHAYDYGGPASHNYGSKGYVDIRRPWGDVLSTRHLLDMPAEERGLTERQIRLLQQRGVRCPVCGETQYLNGRPLAVSELKTATRFCSNTPCRSPLFQFSRRRSDSQQHGSYRLYAEREHVIRQAIAAGIPVHLPPLLPRDQFGYGKVPLAGYIKKRARGRLDLLLVDEVHQYKGVDSDQGYAMHHLAQAARKVVALTGTIYGGKASSLFHLLFRLSPEMRRSYVEPEATGQRRLKSKEWVSAYGILQRIETVTLDEDGRQTANSRSKVRYKELPGGSPAMLPWLLNRSVFLSLGDMGFPLPEYSEIPVPVTMAPEQAMLYESLKEQLIEELKERLVRGDKSLLAGYLYALLFWPDSPRRAKVVRCPRTGDIVASVPGLPESFTAPKEEAILDLCRQEKAQGRNVLLLCQQTDTLDIQPQWKRMLEEAGMRAAILRAAPNKREGWVEKQVKAGVDVIISHPRKVETGIDLLDFPTIVWMAIDYSVYTVLQASRRSWRIGQTRPVKVYYFCYEETIQEDALHLVAAKVAASLRVNGDTVGDDSLADLDELASGDLVATLAKIVTGETRLETRSLQQAFAEANAGLRQANTLIGDYEMVDEEEPMPAVQGNGAGPLPKPVPASNGITRQPSLFSSEHPAVPHHNSNGTMPAEPPLSTPENGQSRPPVPRPRLLMR